MQKPIPDSDEWDEFGEGKKGGPEIHSAKAHRCVDKVQAKGHEESSAWAICTTSIGKRGVYAKGHGGNANPKKKVHEAGANCKDKKKKGRMYEATDHPFFEYNACHHPGGSGKGGQFCSKGAVGARTSGATRRAVPSGGASTAGKMADISPKRDVTRRQLSPKPRVKAAEHPGYRKDAGPGGDDWAGVRGVSLSKPIAGPGSKSYANARKLTYKPDHPSWQKDAGPGGADWPGVRGASSRKSVDHPGWRKDVGPGGDDSNTGPRKYTSGSKKASTKKPRRWMRGWSGTIAR